MQLQLINIYGLHPHLTIIMLIMFPPLLGLNSLKNLKILAPFSTLGEWDKNEIFGRELEFT